jgi:tRNA-splicing ligase RtcB
MPKLKLQGKDLRIAGYPEAKVIGIAIDLMHKHYKHSTKEEALELLAQILASPDEYLEDNLLAKIAAELVEKPKETEADIALNELTTPYAVYGAEK